MKNLVSRDDAGRFRYFSDSIKNEKGFDQAVGEAQLLDVQSWLGNAFLTELISQNDTNELTDANRKLLEGGDYQYDGQKQTFQGLRAVIVYYSFARWRKRDGVTVTNFGTVTKSSDFSEPISESVRMRLSKDDFEIAEAMRLELIKYLNRNAESYPLWQCRTGRRRMNIIAVGE